MPRRIRPAGEAHDDALISAAIERTSEKDFTRRPPSTLKGQINYLLKKLGSTKAVAQELGITPDSVNRYRRGARSHPPQKIADRIDAAVRSRWQPQARTRGQRLAAASRGITIEARARFGYDAPGGTTDDGRFRRLTVHLPASYARRLFDAHHGRSSESPNQVIAEGLRDVYFRDGGSRADQLDVEFTDLDYIVLEF